MGKTATPPKFSPVQAGATAKYVRVPPRKARLVVDAVRGKYVSDALAILKFVPNFAARAIEDVIKSAVANAENGRPANPETGRLMNPLIVDNLKLVRAFIDEGPRIKRLQPRAQGRAYRILKRMCHISVIVEEVEPKPRPVRKPKQTRRAAAPAPAKPAQTKKAAKAVEKEVAKPVAVEETTSPVAEEAAVETASQAAEPVAAIDPPVDEAEASTVAVADVQPADKPGTQAEASAEEQAADEMPATAAAEEPPAEDAPAESKAKE